MNKRILTTPIRDEDISDLRIGDIVHVTGVLVTGRDEVHHRVVHEGLECPVDLGGLGLFHAGPIVREAPGDNRMISVGPTSSVRMDDDAADFMRLTGVKMMIGKGGMGGKTAAACKEHKVVHCVYPGGCAVSAAAQVERIEGVFWRELGMPECLWVLRVREFGPLIVSIDTEGRNMFAENRKFYDSRKEACMAPILDYVEDFMKTELA